MNYIYIICALFALFSTFPLTIKAQNYTYEAEHPLREVRAVWLTTIGGLDWPRTKAHDAQSVERQKEELCRLLDAYKRANINTVILQTRIRGSVIYPSSIEPWDDCLTGHAGKHPGYDPLAYCIEECHKRGMELHAWLVTIPLGKKQSAFGASSIAKRRKDLCRTSRGEMFMIPGKPGTADYVAELAKEIVQHYDVDGISLDYIRYPESTYRFSDDDCYPKNCGISKAEWRRENITRIVRRLHDVIKPIKPWVKLSSSPIGKYRDLSRYSSYGWNCYDAVYQDPQMWLRENLQDMLFPMMYFVGNHFYPFLYNWAECSYGHPVAPGLGIYFLDPREGNWKLNDVRAEMHASRNSGIGGFAFYRGDFLTRNCKGIYDATCDEFCPYPALTTRMVWMNDTIPPTAPTNLYYENNRITWSQPILDSKFIEQKGYILYNIYGSNVYPVDVTKAENLLAVNLRSCSYDRSGRALKCRYFAVTAIDRFGNESSAVQEQRSSCELPDYINVPRLINHDLAKSKVKNKSKKKTNTKKK